MARLTHDEVKHFIEVESNSGCKLISEEYKNAKIKLKIQCRCGSIFYKNFDLFKHSNGTKCRECVRSNMITNHNRKLSYEYVKSFIETESECKLLSSEYKRIDQKIKIKCKCGNEFKTTFSHFKHQYKRQCNECGNNSTSNKLSMSSEEFYKKVFDICKNEYTFLNTYVNSVTKIKIKHNSCGYTYDVAPANFLSGNRCPKCMKKIYDKDTNYFKSEISGLVGKEYTVLSEYTHANQKIKMKHEQCGFEYFVTPHNFLRGRRCPECSSYRKSKGVKTIENIVNTNNLNYKKEKTYTKCRHKGLLYFDFIVEDRVLLEYDGEQHFIPYNYFGGEDYLKGTKQRDKIKNQYCIDNNIPLVRIPYWEFDNIRYIMDNVLKYFNIIEGKCENPSIVEKYYVRDGWGQEKYIAQAPCNKKKIT